MASWVAWANAPYVWRMQTVCGICGWIGNQSIETIEDIESMVVALRDRGPDDHGVWCGNGNRVALGHTRLSIVDLSGSIQPMSNEDGTVIVSYNGEIYNYQVLRQCLISCGHSFRTAGDTEVLVHLYEEYGPKMVEHLDGMYAFAVYDARQHTLLLARDRIGIKPLYYWLKQSSGELLFASDMRAMLANQAVPRRLNRQALAQYLHFGFVVHPASWLEEVHQLEPGQVAIWKAGRLALSKYYEWRYEPRAELASMRTASAELYQTLHKSVTDHLIADVPLGTFLSGGVDSTAVSGFAQKIRRESYSAINSFTVGFWQQEYDETTRARAIAHDLGTHHTEIPAKELEFDRTFMEAFTDSLGEPFADTSALAVYLLCQQARPYVKVALSGDGGDELFLGYQFFMKQRLARRLRLAPATLRRLGANLTAGYRNTVPRRLNKYLRLSLLDDPELIIDWHRRWEWEDLCAVLGGDLFEELFPRSEKLFSGLHDWVGSGATGGFIEQQMRFWMLVVLPCDFLFKVDRMSMAHGLEVRVPMLANRMIEYGRHLPLDMRMRGGRTKEPLRTVAESLSPTVAKPSPKHGFGFPLDQWIHQNFAHFWREWDLTAILTSIGMQGDALDQLVTRYSKLPYSAYNYESRASAAQLFNLMVLGVWLDRHHIHC
ncbi:MAG: asparagine synthase (glutamine-hydrolyzing) [Roseiflexaceae bacterium]